jgi:hypothetical protein
MKKIIILTTMVVLLSGCGMSDKLVKLDDGKTYREIEKCDTIPNPKYGNTSSADLITGGAIGGLIGKGVSSKEHKGRGIALGATLGMIIASEPRLLYFNCRKELRKVE